MRNQSFGKLFHHPNQYACSSKWMRGLITRISVLSYNFGIESENLPNGISVSLRKSIMDTALLGKGIAQFMVCSYVAKNKIKICPNGATMTYNPIVNLVLDTVDVNYVSIVNPAVIESIVTILNHPHFKGCNNIEDIQEKIESVSLLKEISLSSKDESEEDESEEDKHYIQLEIEKNIFLD